MSRKFLFLIIVCLIYTVSARVKVEYTDGREEFTDKLKFADDIFTVNEKEINKKDVSVIRYVIDSQNKKIHNHNAPSREILSGEIEDEIYWIFDKAEELEEIYKDVSGVILLNDSVYKLNRDGTRIFTHHFIGKILKEDVKNWGNISWSFEPGREKINIIKARVIRKDGTYTSFNPTDVKESIPGDSSGSLTRNNLIKNAVIPEVEVGTFVEYIIERETYNPFEKDFFFPQAIFKYNEPAFIVRFEVIIPSDKHFEYITSNFGERKNTPRVTQRDGFKYYVWQQNNIAPVLYESLSPAYQEIVPYVAASTVKKWEQIFNWNRKFLAERIVVTDSVKKKTLQIIGDSVDEEEKVKKIYHWLQQNISYLSIKSGIGSGWSGHRADITLSNKFGDCIDKAVLFSAMGKAADVEVYPVLLMTNNEARVDFSLPRLNLNHAIVKVKLKHREFFLDPTSENFRYPYFRNDNHGVFCLNPLEGKIEWIPFPDVKDEAVNSLYYINLDNSGNIEIINSVRFSGTKEANNRAWWRHQREELHSLIFAQEINSIKAGAELLDYKLFNLNDISKPFQYYWKAEFKNYAVKAKDIMIFEMPWAERSFGEISLNSRNYPLAFSSHEWKISRYILKLPENIKVKFLPENFSGVFKNMICSNYSWSANQNTVILTVSHKRLTDRIPAEDYAEYKEFLTKISDVSRQKLILETR
ncbi:MAG: DUF3857 domain-containing protein [Candidatus Muiribacteriota bacterium]